MIRTYKFRLYPNDTQRAKLEDVGEACRFVYNHFIQKLNSGSVLDRNDMNYLLTELKEQNCWLRNYHSKMLQMISTQVAAANKAWKESRDNGRRTNKCHFHVIKHNEFRTFTYNQSGFKIERHGNTDLLWLSKIGWIEIRLVRTVSNIKQITISKGAKEKWYACISCESTSQIPSVDLRKHVGIDFGIIKFTHDSDDRSVDNPKYLKTMIKPLRRAHHRLSRKQIGSKNKETAKARLQILHEKIRNKRKDFLHKLSTEYARKYDAIFLEKLRISNMVKNHSLARSILDSGWSTFKEFLQYKAKLVLEVDPYNSSAECSRCHRIIPKSLSVRTHSCSYCGLMIDRDLNASKNIQRKGLEQIRRPDLLPWEPREFTPVEIGVPYTGVCSQSMNQEEIHAAMHVTPQKGAIGSVR